MRLKKKINNIRKKIVMDFFFLYSTISFDTGKFYYKEFIIKWRIYDCIKKLINCVTVGLYKIKKN